MDDSKEKEELHIKDKRRFNPDGTIKEDSSGDEAASKEVPRGAGFEINFSTFILSLASSVQISLGLISHPATGKPEVSLPSAKQTIDILGMLEEKTRGNLSPDEENILKQILFELRMQYVEIVNKAKGGEKK